MRDVFPRSRNGRQRACVALKLWWELLLDNENDLSTRFGYGVICKQLPAEIWPSCLQWNVVWQFWRDSKRVGSEAASSKGLRMSTMLAMFGIAGLECHLRQNHMHWRMDAFVIVTLPTADCDQ